MPQELIITAVGPDRPGLVDQMSGLLLGAGGNIAEVEPVQPAIIADLDHRRLVADKRHDADCVIKLDILTGTVQTNVVGEVENDIATAVIAGIVGVVLIKTQYCELPEHWTKTVATAASGSAVRQAELAPA